MLCYRGVFRYRGFVRFGSGASGIEDTMYRRNAASSRGSRARTGSSIRGAHAARQEARLTATRGRLPHMWVAAFSVFSLLLLGTSPAFATGEDPAAASVETVTPAADGGVVSEDLQETPPPQPVVEEPPTPPTETPAPVSPPVTEQPAPPETDIGAQGGTGGAGPEPVQADSTAPPAHLAASSIPAPPYLSWVAVDDSGTKVTIDGLSMVVQGSRDVSDAADEALWAGAPVATVADNTGQPDYTGADLDARAGHFAVKQLADDADPTSVHDVAAGEHYRLRAAVAEGFAVGDAASWVLVTGVSSTDEPETQLLLTVPEAPKVLAKTIAPEVSLLAAPAGADPLGAYQPSFDDSETTSWYSAGSPAQATKIDSFTSAFTQDAQGRWVLGATWNRPNATGTKGWTIEYTVAPERWGKGSGSVLVPQPDRAQGGSVLFIENSNQQNYTTQFCTYTGKTAQGGYAGLANCQTLTGVLSSPDGGFTMKIAWTLPSSLTGQQGCPSTLGSTGYIRSWTGNRQLQAWVAPVTVDPPSNCAKITVNKEVLRGQNSYLEGATFSLYTVTGGGGIGSAVGATWSSCTIGAAPATSCIITVQGTPNASGYWVVEGPPTPGSPAASTFALGKFATGSATGTLSDQRYPGQTGSLSLGSNVSVPRSSGSVAEEIRSIGKTTNSLSNPTLGATCNVSLNIGLVLDLSSSIDNTNAERGAYATAMKNLVNSLVTSANLINIKTITFNESAAVRAGLSGTASASLATSIESYLNNYSNYEAATNWDEALSLAAADSSLDLVLMVTDGAPTMSRSSSGADSVRFAHIEQAVLSANAVKANGAPVWAVGVALPGGSVTNLQAISGTVANTDYFSESWEALNQRMTAIAQDLTCQAPIQLTKQIVDASGGNPTAANGWDVNATASAFSPAGSTAVIGPTPTQTTAGSGGSTGRANWTLRFDNPNGTASLTISENLASKPGYRLYGGSCTISHGTGTTPTTVNFTQGEPSLTLTGITRRDSINCVLQNQLRAATVQVNKVWVVKNPAGQTLMTVRDPALPPNTATLPAGLAAVLNLTGPAAAGASAQAWGTARAGYAAGNTPTLSESPVAGQAAIVDASKLPGCVLTTQAVTSQKLGDTANTTSPNTALGAGYTTPALGAGANVLEITNTVTCSTKLTLLKHVSNQNLHPNDWTLTGTPVNPGTGVAVLSTTGSESVVPLGSASSNVFEVPAGQQYSLAEELAPGSTIAFRNLSIEIADPTAVGGWRKIDGTTVSVALGQSAVYRFVNDSVPAVTVPLTGGMPADLLGITGLLILAIAVGAGLYATRRTPFRARAEVR